MVEHLNSRGKKIIFLGPELDKKEIIESSGSSHTKISFNTLKEAVLFFAPYFEGAGRYNREYQILKSVISSGSMCLTSLEDKKYFLEFTEEGYIEPKADDQYRLTERGVSKLMKLDNFLKKFRFI